MGEDKKSKILAAARSVFLRYGFRRVNMNDIADAAGVSRPALYVLFKNKEDIFLGVVLQWIDETMAAIAAEMAAVATPEEKLERAFELWVVRPFEMMLGSPEAKEIVECSFDFAQACLKTGYDRFEAAIAPVVASLAARPGARLGMAPEAIAHVLGSAVRGFKQAATTPDELRKLIKALLRMTLIGEI